MSGHRPNLLKADADMICDRQPLTVADLARRIEDLARSSQCAVQGVRWLYAQQDVVRALAASTKPIHGSWTRRADRLIGLANYLGVSPIVIWISVLVLLVRLFFLQFTTPITPQAGQFLFIGLRAMADPQLIDDFERTVGAKAIIVDERDIRSFARHSRISLRAVVDEWRQVWKDIAPCLAASHIPDYDIGSCRIAALTRGPRYTYCRAWIRRFLMRGGCCPIAVSAASDVSYAAVAVSPRVVYYPHGLQRRSLVFPDFSEVVVSNRVEAEHFRARLPAAKITLAPETRNRIATRRLAAIAGDYWAGNDFNACSSFLVWAQHVGLPVIVRPHPADNSGYWNRWRGENGVEFDERGISFDDFLEEARPRFLVTWSSTTILDALLRGVVPITLAGDSPEWADFVFPFREVALRWPLSQANVESLVDDPEASARLVTEKLRLFVCAFPIRGTAAASRPAEVVT